MVEPTVRLIDVKPVKNAPGLNLINELARQLAQRRRLCRKAWWDTQATVCLDNKQVERAELGAVRLAATGIKSALWFQNPENMWRREFWLRLYGPMVPSPMR